MLTFEQKPKTTQQTAFAEHAKPSRTHRGHSREVPSILHLQRTIGNQAVQRLLQSCAEELKPGSAFTASAGFAHDFNRIPLIAKARAEIQPKLTISTPGDIFEREADNVADRVMQRPDSGNLESMEEDNELVQPRALAEQTTLLRQRQFGLEKGENSNLAEVTSNVTSRIQTSRGSGQLLPRSTRNFFEPRFGIDFGDVRVHTDSSAAKTAQEMNASEFAIGADIVFTAGQYTPETPRGKRVLSHELTHVIQQSPRRLQRQHTINIVSTMIGSEQPRKSSPFMPGEGKIKVHPSGPMIMRLAQHATAIIAVAQDTSRPINQRAIQVVQRIINQYFSSDASKVRGVIYRSSVQGLEVETSSYRPLSGGPTATAKLVVGSGFAQSTDTRHFARRVQQVRHELDHIDQVRAGMGDPSRSADFRAHRDEREFLAHYRGVIHFTPPAGTGRISHATLARLIDAALGHYYCMSSSKQTQYATQLQQLLQRRPNEVRMSGRSDLGNPPTVCSRP